ncbi:MAG: EpsG family protein [Alistipes sp.]|nr:EpsG family protein [Alistipes sp.]
MQIDYKYSSLEEDKIKLILSFLYPFGAYIYAFKNIGSKTSLIVLYIFYLFYGWTFTPRNQDLDSYRYAERFYNAQTQYSRDGVQGIIEGWQEDEELDYETEKDIFVPITSYYLSKVTDNVHILFLFYAALFGGFMVLSLRYVVTLPTFKNDLAGLALVFMFLFSNPIFNINGIRFWLAGWIATYAVFKIFKEKNYWYLLLLFSTYLIHVAYSIYIVLALLAFLISHIKILVKCLPVLFLVSFFVSSFAAEFINSFESYFPPVVQNMVESYLDEHYAAERANRAMYAQVLNSLPRILWNIMMFLIIANHHRQLSGNKIYVLAIILLSFSNFMIAVPSVGVRFTQLCVPFVVYLWVQTMTETKWHSYIKYVPILYAYKILYWYRYTASTCDPFLYLTNSIHLIVNNLV